MKSFILYQLKNHVRSLMFIPPVALYICWIGILYAYSTTDALGSYTNSAVILFVIATWISMNIFRLEEEAEKHILLVHLRQREHFLYGKWFACVMMIVPLIVFAHVYPIVTNSIARSITMTEHILSLYVHFGLAVLGILIGSFFCGTSMSKSRYVWLLCALTVTASFAYSQLVELLPKWLSWLLWLLPPIRFFYEPLKVSGSSELPAGLLASFSMAMFYILVVGVLVIKMFMKKEKA